MRNLHQLFVLCTAHQIIVKDFTKFCSLLRIYELYKKKSLKNPFSGATNVEEIQDELDGLLFGQQDKSDKIEKLEKSIPIPDFAGR